MPDLAEVLAELAEEISAMEDRGKVATYIPELGKVDPKNFGLAVCLNDGQIITAGDAEVGFSIQSISKVFTLTLALGHIGDSLWRRVGREPSGNAFNSIVQLEQERGIPRNPFINAGAIVLADVLLDGHQPKEAIGETVRFLRFLADDDTISIDRDVAASEKATGFRNVSLANFMRAFGNLNHSPELTLGVYFHTCAIEMSCVQLARAGRFLASDGKNPDTGHSVVSAERARRINSLMLTCGHYDGSGDFAFRVGLPGKSGVGGGILAIVPGIASIAAWSPGLNENGNSKLGSIALARLAKRMGWSIFAPREG